jgi:predicted signal transduction protein with EAL and GGDEF domain
VSDGGRDWRLTLVAIGAVVAVAAGVLAWALPGAIRFLPEAPGRFWAMALAALVVDIPLFGLRHREYLRVRATLSVCFAFAIFVLWGAAPAVLVQAVAGAVSAIGQRYRLRAGLYLVSRLVFATAIAELVVDHVNPGPLTPVPDGGDLIAFTLLALVWFAISYGLLTAVQAATQPYGGPQSVAVIRLDLVRTAASAVIVVPLLVTVPGWWPLLIVVPMLVLNQLALEQVRHERQLSRDPVSGLLNLQGLVGGVQAMTAIDIAGPAGPRPFGIVLVNVESVVDINRTLGRDVYEKAIGAASRRLIEAFGEDRAARLSGDSIVILVPDLSEEEALAATHAVVAVLEPPIEVDGIPFTLYPVGGVALSPEHGVDLGSLLGKAELAAAEARRTGQRAAAYAHRAAELAERRIALLREMHSVLRDRVRHPEISVLYQPQVEIATGRLFSVEALLRWTHPDWGPIRTDELIRAIEPSDVMHLLTRHVLATAAAQIRRWNEQGDEVRVAVNVSVQDLREPAFIDELSELVRAYGIRPHQLTIEVTERMLITPQIQQITAALARQGVGLSLDDFGSGHASLQQLRQLPLTEVKVDRSYVQGMVENPADAAIVTSVYEFARALHVDMIAEGIEDQATVDALAKLGGTIGQGWFFGRAMTVEQLQEWRRSHPAAMGPSAL